MAPWLQPEVTAAHITLWDVTEVLVSGRAPSKAELSSCKAALERLQHVLRQKGLFTHNATILLLFVFRPFTAHLLSNICSSMAPCNLALLQLLQQVLCSLGANPDPEEQKQRRTLAAKLLADLAACHFYTRDPKARSWLEGSWKCQLKTYINGNSSCPREPISAQQHSGGSNGMSGLQALITLLGYASGNSATSIDSVLKLAEQLLSCSSSTPPDLQLQHLWVHWLNLRVIRQARRTLADLPLGLPAGDLAEVTCSLQAWPSDVLQLPVQQLAAALLDILVNDADGDGIVSTSFNDMQQQLSLLDIVPALVMQLDGGSGAAYHVLIMQLLPDVTSHMAAEDSAGVESPRKADPHRSTPVLQLLGLALQTQQGARSITLALLDLVQQPGAGEVVAAAAGGLLSWHCNRAMPISPVLQLLADITTSATLDIQIKLASVKDWSIMRLLLPLAPAAMPADAAFYAQPQHPTRSLQAAGHDLTNDVQEQVVLVLARLVPHVADLELMAAVLQCLLKCHHPADIMAAREATSAPSGHHLATVILQPKEQTALLQALCKLDATAEADAGQAESNGWLSMYFLRLLKQLQDDQLQDNKGTPVQGDGGTAAGGLNNAAFFSPEQAGLQRSQQRTCADDFTRLSNLLEAHVQRAKAAAAASSTSAAGTRQSTQPFRLPVIGGSSAASIILSSDSSATAPKPDVTAGLVLTPTTLENINRVLDVVDNPAPLLLEGPTGVGKSATVTEAAGRLGKRLVRFNLSSSITPDDLMGRVMMKAGVGTADQADHEAVSGHQQQGFVLQHQLQPFAAAFAAGDWLLLDELNLAPDDVLQCIEQALDAGVITLQNASSAAEPIRVVPRAPGFRLFAAQNPNAGWFKGRREPLSHALINRFVPVVFQQLPAEEWEQVVAAQLTAGGMEAAPAASLAVQLVSCHIAIQVACSSNNFPEVAAYTEMSIRELLQWQQGLTHREQVGWLGLHLYCSRLRHVAARLKIAEVFISHFKLPKGEAQRLAQAAAAVAAGAVDAFPDQDVLPGGVKLKVPTASANPFVLTPRVLRAWALAGRFVVSEDPLLLVGKDGCGKSEALKALSWLLGEQLQQLNITPETELSALVGQLAPNDQAGKATSGNVPQDPVVWVDGVVTTAFKAGQWLCLDNLGEAEASVLERLNPLLERPTIWTLTEQGCTEPLPCLQTFRFMATMTPPSRQGKADVGIISAELSPAMYNRLSIVVMDDVLEGSDEQFYHEMSQLAQFAVVGEDAVKELRAELHQLVVTDSRDSMPGLDHLAGLAAAMSREHVLSGSRQAVAQAVAAAIACNMPVLLEGPAAVGKTSLVTALARHMPQPPVLERVNNTESTGLQDYIGSYLPAGDGTFTFHEGPLLRCARRGHWLLLDELNLADPCVLSVLCPLLEGATSLSVPGTDLVLPVHPGLRLFATQNSAKYANRHRLPVSIRSRFLEVQVCDFTEQELFEIISRRDLPEKKLLGMLAAPKSSRRHNLASIVQSDKTAAAKPLAKLAALLSGARKRDGTGGGMVAGGQVVVTMREVALVQVAFAVAAGEPVMLLGPTSFKSTVVDMWCQLMGQDQALVKVHLSPASEGFDLIGQILPYSYIEALQLIPKSAAAILARLKSLQSDKAATAPLSMNSTLHRLQQLLLLDLPEQLSQHSHQLEQAMAAQQKHNQTMLDGEEGGWATSGDAIADLLGLNDGMDWETSSAVPDIVPPFMSEADLAAAASAAEQFAPSLLQVDPQGVQKEDVFGVFSLDSSVNAWEDRDETADWSLAMTQEPGANPSSAGPENAFDLLFGDSDGAAADASDRLDTLPAPGMADSSPDVSDNSFELLFGSDSSTDHDLEDATSRSDREPEPMDLDTSESSSKREMQNDLSDTSALPDQRLASTTLQLQQAGSPFSTSAGLPAAVSIGPAGDAMAAAPSATHQAETSGSFGEFVAGLSLQQRAQLQSGEGRLGCSLQPVAALPVPLVETVQQALDLLEELLLPSGSDAAAKQMLWKIQSLWRQLQHPTFRASDPLFLFRDGPVSTAAKQGQLLLLEDFDSPSQAATERLNSLLEPDPSFALTEDITQRADGMDVLLPPSFQVFATVHQASPTQRLNISPATRSRFTTIAVHQYTPTDVSTVLHQKLTAQLCKPGGGGKQRGASARQVQDLLSLLLSLKASVEQQLRVDINMRQLMHCIQFVAAHISEPSLTCRLLVGFRWLVMDSLQPDLDQQQQLMAKWLLDQPESSGLAELQQLVDTAFQAPDQPDLQDPARLLQTLPNGCIRLAYTGVAVLSAAGAEASASESASADSPSDTSALTAAQLASPQLLSQVMQLSCTPSVINNMARIFAATTVQGPLLLEGAPGIGKTAVVQQVAALLGYSCERINFSANTTLEQLLGSYIPKVVAGQRVFAWQDGSLVRAVRQGKWLLLDEINLAPTEVLAAIAPLFDRDTNLLPLPNSGDDPLNITNVKVFATMNPTSAGGGRHRLPRSVRNLFTAVQLQKPSADEVKSIALDIFGSCLNAALLDQQQAVCLLNFHTAAVKAAERRDLGRSGAAAEFNLRDLIKVRDMSLGNALGISRHAAPTAGHRVASATDLRLQVLCKVLFTVYGSRFSASADQDRAQQLIAEHMEVDERDLIRNWDTSIECSIPSTLRVGAVFLGKGYASDPAWLKALFRGGGCAGDQVSSSQLQATALTPLTLRKLEQLAAASNSGRVVLLEGDTCSGKTQLVIELARLAQRHLVTINLTAETETSQLIGQWMPANVSGSSAALQPSVALSLQQLIQLASCHCCQLQGSQLLPGLIQQLVSLLSSMPESWLSSTQSASVMQQPAPTSTSSQQFELMPKGRLESLLQKAYTLLLQLQEQTSNSQTHYQAKHALHRLEQQLLQKQQELDDQQSSQSLSFVWVESLLVAAMREGRWVLLDNLTSAPPDVMERLNSLFEDSPSLTLYEHSDGEVLSRAAGTIHQDFRLFATADPGRVSSHKLSSALLNRVIRIHLLPLDSHLTPDTADQHDLLHILVHKFAGVHGGCELATLCVRFHARVLAEIAACTVKPMGGYRFTSRTMLYAAQGALHYMNAMQCSPVDAAAKALLTTYMPGIANKEQELLLLAIAGEVLRAPDLANRVTYEQLPALVAGTDAWEQQAAEVGSKLAQLEEVVAAAAWAIVPGVPVVAVAVKYAQQVVSCILQPVLEFLSKRVVPVLRQLLAPAAALSRSLQHQLCMMAWEPVESKHLLLQLQNSLTELLAVEQMLPWMDELTSSGLTNAITAADGLDSNSEVARFYLPLTGVLCGVLLGLPLSTVAKLSAVRALNVGELTGLALSQALEPPGGPAAKPSSMAITGQVAEEKPALLVSEAASSTSKCDHTLLLLLLPSPNGQAAFAALLLQQHKRAAQLMVHLIASSKCVSAALPTVDAWLAEQQQSGGQPAELVQHTLQTEDVALLELGAAVSGNTAADELLAVLMVARIEQLLTGSQSMQAAEVQPGPNNADNVRARALLMKQQTATILQHASQAADNTLTQMQQLLGRVQHLHGCLTGVVLALDDYHGAGPAHGLSASDAAAAANAAQQQLKATVASSYSLRSKAQEVQQLVSHLYSIHVAVPNLSTGHALKQQLQLLAKHRPHCIELTRLSAFVREQMPCADVYCQYAKLVSQLRTACKFQSSWVQQKVTELNGMPGQLQATTDQLYAAAPAATEFMLQLCSDVLGSFDTTPTSIVLIRQYQQEQLQHLDEQLVNTFLRLAVPQHVVDSRGWNCLLMSCQDLLTAAAAERPIEDQQSAAQQQLQRRALMMSNAELKLQQRHELLSSLSQQVERLLQEAKATKPCPNVLHLQASNPLYQQIPYLGAGMEQQDCAVPAAAWQRDACKQPSGSPQHNHQLLLSSISSHEFIDDEQLEQLQLAFAQLDSLLPDSTVLEQHSELISKVEAVLQFNMQCSSWNRAIEVCQQLLAVHNAGGPEDDHDDPQQLAVELAALCTVLSPAHLALQLQHHNLRSKACSGVLPPAFMHQVVSGYAAFKRQYLSQGCQQLMGPAEVAEACQWLQEVADGNSSIAAMGMKLIGQFELLQMLYRQSAALSDTICSSAANCSAVLEPMAFTLLDAAVLVAGGDLSLMLKLNRKELAAVETARRAAESAVAKLKNSSGADVHNHRLKKHLQVAEAVIAAAEAQPLQPHSAQNALSFVHRLKDACFQLKNIADEFQLGDALASGMSWLADTLQVALNSTGSCITDWPQHQAFAGSMNSNFLLQHHPRLQHVAHELQQQLGSLILASSSRTATRQQVLEHAGAVLEICQLQQQQHEEEEGETIDSNLPVPGALDVTVSPETALAVSSGASELLDDFKAALGSCTEQLLQGREVLEGCCRLLSDRGELLQKEVLKAEVALVGRGFKYQAQVGQEEHLNYLLLHSSSLWKQAAAPALGSSSQHKPTIDIAGLVPDWSAIQLNSVAQLPALLKLLEAAGPAEAVGQLEPASMVVQQWLGQAQVMVACLTHGIEGQGQLLRSVYDFCPRVLKVSSLLAEHRRNALLGKRLLEQPLQSVQDACSCSDAGARAQPSHSIASSSQLAEGTAADPAATGADSPAGEAAEHSLEEFKDALGDAASDSSAEVQDHLSHNSDASAAELLDSLLHNHSSTLQPASIQLKTKPPSGLVDDSNTAGRARDALHVLSQLRHLEEWAFCQISEVVFEKLSGVMAGIRLDGCLQHESAVQQLFEQWVQGCDELVKARELGRRNVLERWMKNAEKELRDWRQKDQERQQARQLYEQQLALVKQQLKEAFELCCHLAAAQQAAQCNPWDCCATELFLVVGTGITPTHPLFRNPVLEDLLQQCRRAPLGVQLSASYVACATLSKADKQDFKRFAYAVLQLPAKSGRFLSSSGRGFAQEAVIHTSASCFVDIQIIDPADCQLTVTFMGELKDRQHNNALTAFVSAVTGVFSETSRTFDPSRCAQIGGPLLFDLVALASRGYWSHIKFGQGSTLTGLQLRSAEASARLRVPSDRQQLRQQLRSLLEQLQHDCSKLSVDQLCNVLCSTQMAQLAVQLRSLSSEVRLLPPLEVLQTDDDMCNVKQPINTVSSPAMQAVLVQQMPLQLQHLAQHLDTAISATFRSLGLALCILVATAASVRQLQTAEAQVDKADRILKQLARALMRSDANAAASQHVEYLKRVVKQLLQRKRRLLNDLQQSRQLLSQAAAAAARACSQEDKQKLAAAMAAVTHAQDAEVRFSQLPSGELFALPSKVDVDFGVQLTGTAMQSRFLRVINSTSTPVRLQLLDAAPAGHLDLNGDSAADLAQAIQGLVEQMVQVLEGAVLPHNKHTRRRAEESGPSLYLPALIKAASSNYTNRKIFASKTAGGKRTYQVALLLDVSQSMQGHLQQCGLEVLAVMADALGKVGLDGFVVMTFGAAPVLVKDADTAWDGPSKLALMEQLNCKTDQHLASMDAAAVQAAAALLCANNNRAAKKMFVITDGYGTSGLALASALQQADQADVEVVGLSVGFDRTHVPVCYQKWATAAMPASLPDALLGLYAADETLATATGSGSSGAPAPREDWSELMPVLAGAAQTVEEVLQQQSSVFAALVKQLSQQKEAKLIHAEPDDMSVDVCFCLDVTGSMSGWIEACKAQVQAIASGLLPKIQKRCPDIAIRVRWGLVAYRDEGDAQQLQELPFTEDNNELVSMVKQLRAQGGGDEPEDMMAALSTVAQMDWKAKARFLVLIADSPAHGRDCNDDPKDAYPSGSPRPNCDLPTVMKQLCKQQVDVMLMPVKALKLDKTAAAMRRHYACPAEDRKLSVEPLFDGSKQPAHAFHFVFCLDSSGSMSGQPWQDVNLAYRQLLQRRSSDQCAGDYVSVVTFDTSPLLQIKMQPLVSAPTSFSGGFGGTYFAPALQACDGLIRSTPAGLTPILVFMSDGCDGRGGAVQAVQQLHRAYAGMNLQVHTIAFGMSHGSGNTLLRDMASAAGGQFHQAAGGMQLSQVFVQIAAECTAVDGLVKRFSEILSEMISVKVMMDYL
eukprot:gene3371-3646_t